MQELIKYLKRLLLSNQSHRRKGEQKKKHILEDFHHLDIGGGIAEAEKILLIITVHLTKEDTQNVFLKIVPFSSFIMQIDSENTICTTAKALKHCAYECHRNKNS